jgi:hypothetical protein
MLKTRAIVLAKVEASYGVDPTPTAALNAILCEEPEIETIAKKLERNHTRSNYGANVPVNVGEGCKITFGTEVKGSGALGVAPEIGPLLRACNFTETINAGVDVDYDPNSAGSAGESVTLYFYRHDLLHKVVGCRGTFKLEVKAGEYGKLNFEFTGIYAGAIDGSIPSQTVNQTLPPVFVSASLSIDSYAAVVENLSIDIGNEIGKRPDANAATGILEYFIKDRKASAEIDPEVVALATKDFHAMWENSSQVAFAATIGQTGGNKCVISAPKVVVDELKYGDRESQLIYAMPLILTPNAGDDEVQFKFS